MIGVNIGAQCWLCVDDWCCVVCYMLVYALSLSLSFYADELDTCVHLQAKFLRILIVCKDDMTGIKQYRKRETCCCCCCCCCLDR